LKKEKEKEESKSMHIVKNHSSSFDGVVDVLISALSASWCVLRI